jgi:predicted RNase H-like HicB family nuclease
MPAGATALGWASTSSARTAPPSGTADGGYHVYAPDLPGLHTQGETLDEGTANAEEALALYVEGLRAEGMPIGAGIVRRKLPLLRDGAPAGRLRRSARPRSRTGRLGGRAPAWQPCDAGLDREELRRLL